MPLSDSIVRSFKKIQSKSVKERKKIQVFIVIVCLIFLLILGTISLKLEFAKSGNPFPAINKTDRGRQLGELFGKIGGLGRDIKDGFNKIKEDKEIRKIFENYGN